MLDIILLRIMKHKRDYTQILPSVSMDTIDEKTRALLTDFGKYFEKFPEHDKIDIQVFLPRFKQWHHQMTDETFNSYVGVLRNINQDVDDSTRAGVLNQLHELTLATEVANACKVFDDGDATIPIADKLTMLIDKYKLSTGVRAVPWDETDISDLLAEDLDMSGIKWRLNCLNQSMRPMRPGDFGIIAGRPDKGKTSFLSSEATFMAGQLPEDRNIIWLNNEGMSGRIVKRLYQSALGLTITELVELNQKKKLKAAYEKVVGRLDRIRVVNIHGMHVGQVDAIMEHSNPGIVIYDMIDNIRGFGEAARTDLQLEQMYQWAREQCVKYSCIGLATSQISADGKGLQFPTQDMLKDSKTGKQGACDFQLMIGASDDIAYEYSRFLSLPKNKLRRDGHPGDPRCEVQFHPSTSRYEDIPNGA